MLYLTRLLDWKFIVAIIILSLIVIVVGMEMSHKGTIFSVVSSMLANGLTSFFQFLVTGISELYTGIIF